MTYQLRMEKEFEVPAAVTLQKADLRNEHQTNIAHVEAGVDPRRAIGYL
jgi:hypothetical protein